MNCGQARNLMLLDLSGELDAERRGELDAHAAGCEECAAYRRETGAILEQARLVFHAAPAPAPAVCRVLAESRRLPGASRRVPIRVFPTLAWAAAALALLWIGVMLVGRVGRAPDAGFASAEEFAEIIRAISREADDGAGEEADDGTTGPELDREARHLASQLFLLETLEIEALLREPEVTPERQAPSTDLQSRSSDAVPRIECA